MSELYATMLMVGVTLSLGSVVVAAAMQSFGQAQDSASLGTSLQASASGVQIGLVYVAVAPSGSCPAYQKYNEGTSMTLALFDYGATGFTPVELVVNSTIYQGSYPVMAPGTLARYGVTLGSCAHSSGLTMVAVDAQGDEVQLES